MNLSKEYSIFLPCFLISLLVFMSIGTNSEALVVTPELLNDKPISDFSLAGQKTNYLNLADDPTVLQKSTFLGGSLRDSCQAVAIDSLDDLIVVGNTQSADFPTSNAFDSTLNGDNDGFVTKYSSGGLSWSSFLGGSSDYDTPQSVAVDSDDCVIVVGNTQSADFPVLDAYDTTINGDNDVFISKFSSFGDLIWSSFLGGAGSDIARSVTIDSEDNVLITGTTKSADFPILNAVDSTFNGDYDVFVAKFNSSGELIWSTFTGGSGNDQGYTIAIDSLNNVVVTGGTDSSGFPVLDGFDETYNGGLNDAFIFKLSSSGDLIWSSFFGGTENDYGHSVVIDSQDNVLITGGTRSTDFPHLNGFDVTQNGDSDAFVSKFNSSGELIWSSFLGGTGHDIALSVAINSLDRIVVTGGTDSSDFFVFNGLDEVHNGGFDVFITMYNSSGGLIESTFLGGSSYETANSIAIDSKNSTIVTGETWSSDFPVNGYDITINGDQDIFLCRLTTTPLLYDDDILVEEFVFPIGSFLLTISSFALAILIYRRKKRS